MSGIEVHVRLRPVASGSIWSASDSLLYCTAKPDARFMFNRVHPASVTNATLFHTLAPLAQAAFGGQNVCVCAYGQTGSGKTHCMMGTHADPGLVRRAARILIDQMHAKSMHDATLACGFIEVYNEVVTDLLSDHKQELVLQEAPDGSAILKDRTMRTLCTEDDFIAAVDKAESNRRYGQTDLNDHSSRSHVVLTFEIAHGVANHRQRSMVQFVDLAGSECAGRSNTEGSALREGGYINRSLLTLGNVVDAIVDARQHIPYRESKLTRILRNCLGGKSLTFLVCCVNPTRDNYDQTLTSLRFAQRAMKVTSDPGLTLVMAPLVCHAVAHSVSAREKLLRRREELAYERGIQDAYLQCRDGVGNIMAQIDDEARGLLDQFQRVADAVLVHDQQRAMLTLQEAQRGVQHKGSSLADSERLMEDEEQRAHGIADRRAEVDELRAAVGADAASVVATREQLAVDRAELARQRRDAATRDIDAMRMQHQAAACATEREYWQELNGIAMAHLSALFPAGTTDLSADAPMTAATQLRQLQLYKSRIEKEKRELDDLNTALRTINECLTEQVPLGELCDHEDEQLSRHIESVEASQRAARAASARVAAANATATGTATGASPASAAESPRHCSQTRMLSQGSARGGGAGNAPAVIGASRIRSPSPKPASAAPAANVVHSASVCGPPHGHAAVATSNTSRVSSNVSNSLVTMAASYAGGGGGGVAAALAAEAAAPTPTTATGPRATMEALRAAQDKWLSAADRAEFAATASSSATSCAVSSSTSGRYIHNNTSGSSSHVNNTSGANRSGIFTASNMNSTAALPRFAGDIRPRTTSATPPRATALKSANNISIHNISANSSTIAAGHPHQQQHVASATPFSSSQVPPVGATPNTSQRPHGPAGIPLSLRPRDADENAGPAAPANTAARAAARKLAAASDTARLAARTSLASSSPTPAPHAASGSARKQQAATATLEARGAGAVGGRPAGGGGGGGGGVAAAVARRHQQMQQQAHDAAVDVDAAGTGESHVNSSPIGMVARRHAATAAATAIVERNLFLSPSTTLASGGGTRKPRAKRQR